MSNNLTALRIDPSDITMNGTVVTFDNTDTGAGFSAGFRAQIDAQWVQKVSFSLSVDNGGVEEVRDYYVSMDEEGKFNGKRPNLSATGLADVLGVGLMKGDVIAGPVIITRMGEDYEDVPLDESDISAIRNAAVSSK